VQDAAATHRTSVAAWLRHAMRQVTPDDFPASWHAEAVHGRTPRSHDSRYYGHKYTLRFDEATSTKLEQLMEGFDRSAAAIIRQLIAQATPEMFPPRWQLAADEQRQRKTRPGKGD
jgi:predicted transcriptional regulator